MSAVPKDNEAAVERPLPLCRRQDVSVHPQQWGETRGWVLKDPMSLRYFQLHDEEFAIWQMLDGRTSLGQIQRGFAARFAPMQLQPPQIMAFVARLYQSGLVVADSPGQGRRLWESHLRTRRRTRWGLLTNLLAIRVASWDPEPWLRRWANKLDWLFSAWLLTACALLVLVALLLATVQFESLLARLPDLPTFLSPGNLVWLLVALACAKCLHELGHALTCRYFGGECHEIGILLLVFMPCLYCNVSDAWLFPNRWQRIAVSAAGIIVEIVLAAVCLILWWFTAPGLLNAILLNLVIVCSVNTLLFNGNPLLRFDGYYILADLLGVPNLGQQSRALLWGRVQRWFLVHQQAENRSLPSKRRSLLACYAVASTCYRWSVVAAILYMVYQLAKTHDVEVLGAAAVSLAAIGMISVPVSQGLRFFQHPGNRQRVRPGRVRFAILAASAMVGALMLVPLPYRIVAPAVIQPQDARRVYVTVSGRLDDAVSAGAAVSAGQQLAHLVNLDLQRKVVELDSQRKLQRLHLANLRARQGEDPAAATQIPAATADLEDLENRFRQVQQDAERLVLRAPTAGIVIPPPQQLPSFYRPGVLHGTRSTPLDARAQGSYLEVGSLLCLVGDPSELEALVVIDQSQIQFVHPGQRVRLQLDASPSRILRGRIVEFARLDLKVAPRELAEQSDLLVHFDREGIPRPAATSYQA
ncbi:MAG: HlyD family efflux transporter periplasmic adaptor subunit, partial [Planctomycetaceae bacterium]